MISKERLEKALTYLAETDEQEADLKANADGAKRAMDAVFAMVAAHSQGTVLEREAAAYESKRYQDAESHYLCCLAEHGAIKNKRATETILIEVWRSLNAARNKGQIV